MRTKALTFFIDKCSDKYHDYDPENFRDLAFVPAVLGSEKLLAKPFEVRNLIPITNFPLSKRIYARCTLAPNGRH